VVVVGHRHQLAQVALGVGGAVDEGLAAMADLHHRGALGLPLEQFVAHLARTVSGSAAGPALKL
jgi:hypothetical protein